MTQAMRWYGPNDVLSLKELKQAGITGIVTALHEIPVGEIWSKNAILERKEEIEGLGLQWSVIESLPVHEDIKKRSGNFEKYIENYKISLRNVGECGIEVVAYNFMPILDWVRTDHFYENNEGATVLRYDPVKFAFFDLFLLKRKNVEQDYSDAEIAEAKALGERLSSEEKEQLFKNILLGLPGSKENFTPEIIKDLLESYSHINDQKLRENLVAFLKEVAPVAAESGVSLAIHPDDPPFSVLGLPRVVSNQSDLEYIFSNVDNNANGLCYCTGSIGANPKNDLLQIFEKFSDRIHFLHLRNVKRETSGVFMESDHLDGDVPMTEVMKKILKLQQEKQKSIPMRPDHGYLHSMEKDKNYYAGYSFIGRLKGLAELRGLELGILETHK
ncbi:mannonate dehydratase [Salinimicrobium sp. MT39]|uniref:Mannonate dehydratase n=1 Tax=Salinimicrobium profundisediminis TaxID=2994553 RepID=A0A9X3I0F4_9FLAO|nr:mannonate dehydratase [Salinimicrobium profundisediminis]MCX2837950.1 mannonate dehydratase [Salinimicrobium profundisediminis]